MKNRLVKILCVMGALLINFTATAQCAMCTKTAAQLGEKPAEGLNSGIVYLMLTPFVIIGFIGYRWWKGRVR
jgi:hypothetical protein